MFILFRNSKFNLKVMQKIGTNCVIQFRIEAIGLFKELV